MTAMVLLGDCLERMRELPDNSVDAVVTDPPSGIGFMGDKNPWDSDRGGRDNWISWLERRLREAKRVLKPGGYALIWALPRTSHWTGMAIEDAGFTVVDRVSHLFGCLSEDTEIFVDGEWVSWDKAAEGRLALCYDPDKDSFSWQPIQKRFVYPYHGSAVSVRGENTDQLLTPNHRCLVEHGGSFDFQEAGDLASQCEVRVPILESVRELSQDLPVPEQHTGKEEQAVFSQVCEQTHLKCEHRETETSSRHMRNMQGSLLPESQQAAKPGPFLLQQVSWGLEVTGSRDLSSIAEIAGDSAEGSLYRGTSSDVTGEVSWATESVLERGRNSSPPEGKLQEGLLCPMSGSIPGYGSEGWVRDEAQATRSPSRGTFIVSGGSGSPHQSRSDRQQNRELDALSVKQRSQEVRASGYTTSDLVRIEEVPYEGIMWCVSVPTGSFVARRNGKVFITGNSGFPKNYNISKGIDKKLGYNTDNTPVSDEAKKWEGFGTALKPAGEDWWLAMKPREGTIVDNLLNHGTGALNVDEARIDTDEKLTRKLGKTTSSDSGWVSANRSEVAGKDGGRWPANIVFSHNEECDSECVEGCAVKQLDEQSGVLKSGHLDRSKIKEENKIYGVSPKNKSGVYEPDSGGASRFYYCAKPSKKEKNVGVNGTNDHSTTKSVDLMSWLTRLVTPPGGTVLDPFCGSGTTGMACALEGFEFIGIEEDPKYVKIAEQRIAAAERGEITLRKRKNSRMKKLF